MPPIIPLTAAEVTGMAGEMLTAHTGAQVIDKKTAHEFINQLLFHMKNKYPEASARVLEHESDFRDLILLAIDDYISNQDHLHANNFYQMRMEDRLRLFGSSRARIGQIIDNKTFIGMTLQMICNVVAAVVTVIVLLPYSENFYRDLKYCFSQLTVGVLRDTIGATAAALADVAAAVSIAFLIIPRLFLRKEVVDKMPVLGGMQQLLRRRIHAYGKLWGNFTRQGLIFRLTFMQQDIRKMSEQEQLTFLRMYDRVNSHSKQYGMNSEHFFDVVFGLLGKNETPERLEAVLNVMDKQLGYIAMMPDASKVNLLEMLADKFSKVEDVDLDEKINNVFTRVLKSVAPGERTSFSNKFLGSHRKSHDYKRLDDSVRNLLYQSGDAKHFFQSNYNYLSLRFPRQ